MAVIRRMACSSAEPRGAADCVISTGRPTTECCAELGLDSRTVSKWAQNRRWGPQARPGLRQRCRKRPSKGRTPLGGTIGTPYPFPIAQKSRPQELTPGSALSAFLAAYSPSEFQAVLRSAPFRLDAVRFSGLPRLLSSDSVHRNYQLRRCEEPPFAGLLRRQEGLP